ncbi:MAG: hypothetical protein ABIZ49_11465 [Opitutaceae bacterium]
MPTPIGIAPFPFGLIAKPAGLNLRFGAFCRLLIGFVLASASLLRAQVASDATGVSVAIKALDIVWHQDSQPDDTFEFGIYSLNGLQETGAYGRPSETPQIMARMVVGRTYLVTMEGAGVYELILQAVPLT